MKKIVAIVKYKDEGETINNISFEWSRASNKGIPFEYRLILMINGWEKEKDEKNTGYWSGRYKKDDILVSIGTSEPDSFAIASRKGDKLK
ncbi:hypothetical protein ACQKII_02375 [Lysinibacillus sp. NPDC048646]|uniref:hypothetical protein n=1 Tax=Lysinibacillus sp. NPDC048646 TaxID=3390574 RepID=UPI003D03E5C5